VSSEAGSAEIVITRERAYMAMAVTWSVLLDGQNVGALRNGDSLTVHSAPGRHNVVVGPGSILQGGRSEPFWFSAEAGQRIAIACVATMWRPRVWGTGALPGQPAGSGAATTAAPPVRAAGKVIEGSRHTVPLGDETRVIDNSQSGSPTTRVVRLTREWTRTCSVDAEHITTLHGSAGLGIHMVELKAEAERTLSRSYSSSATERETFEEEVTLNIGEHTRSEVVFSWKEIRQQGDVLITGQGFEARVPYEVVVGLTFDQQQIDTAR
jgi:hypothetical protein